MIENGYQSTYTSYTAYADCGSYDLAQEAIIPGILWRAFLEWVADIYPIPLRRHGAIPTSNHIRNIEGFPSGFV